MKTIKLLGELGEKFGRIHRFDVRNPAEAIRALRANHKGFEQHLLSSDPRGVGYKVLVRDEPLAGVESLQYPSGQGDISFVPVMMGSGGEGGGALQIFAGALLVVAGALVIGVGTVTSPFTGGGTLSLVPLGSGLISAGVGLIFGGVAQIMAIHALNKEGPQESGENKPSYYFNGAVNTIQQGHPIPLAYGRLIVGSAVISAGVTVEEIPVDS